MQAIQYNLLQQYTIYNTLQKHNAMQYKIKARDEKCVAGDNVWL